MMLFNHDEVYLIVRTTAIVTTLIAASALLLQREQGERSRTFLGIAILISGLITLIQYLFIETGSEAFTGILPISFLESGLAITTLLSLYPMEVINPGWLNKKRILILLSPMIFTTILVNIYRIIGFRFKIINNFSDFSNYILDVDVLIRILFVGISIFFLFHR